MTATAPLQIALDGAPLARLLGEPNGPIEALEVDRAYVISRFAWIRRDGDALVAETSLKGCAVALDDTRAQILLLAFSTPRRLDAGLAELAGLPHDSALELGGLFSAASLVVDEERARLEEEPPLALWEFHDLLFHARSRMGRSRGRHGGTFHFLDRFPPAPALPPGRWPEEIELEHPDFDRLEQEDPPLAQVQSRRRSIRQYGEHPLTLAQLSEFLFRVGRIEDYWETPIPGPEPNSMSFAARPYPSAGAMYPLELYVAVHACEGLTAGLYQYDAAGHRLARVVADPVVVEQLLSSSGAGMGTGVELMQALVVITARVPRVAWKYESIAYELVLKDVGVLLQTMYLTATAMGLAPCAIGSGDSDLFARASGIDYYEEPAVGEFALGSRPSASPPRQ